MSAELAPTAVIAAANAVLANEGCFDKLRYPEDCTCTYDVTAAALAAALPHVREQLARQVEAAGASIEQAQLAAMGGLLTPLPSGVVAGYAQAARIVRGLS